MANYTTITFNAVTLYINNATPYKKQKSGKQVIGRKLIEIPIIGINATEWNISLNGVITGSSVSDIGTKRAAIEALDDSQAHAFVDGIHDGTYYVKPSSLSFTDVGDNAGMAYNYRLELIEQ